MLTNDCFGADYQEARRKFLEAARACNAKLEAACHPERGPDGGELFTDIARIGAADAEAMLVMISATHGVEGFCGSGAQIDWMRRGEASRLPQGVGVLLIHAINPYGFAWLRRTTHENVDLNRNWIDFAKPLPENREYEKLCDAIVPQSWKDESRAAAGATLAAYAQKNGMAALQQAVSGGQYTNPQGVWFGGQSPTWSRRQQEAIFGAYLRQAGRIAILDYHTGLGPSGYSEQISVFAGSTHEYRRARSWYGANVVSMPDGASSSALILGDGLQAAPALLPRAEVTPLALEYGTKPPMEVVEAVRADAWLHAHGDPLSSAGQAIKRQIRDAFYEDTDIWRGMVLGQSLQACRQAVIGLAAGS